MGILPMSPTDISPVAAQETAGFTAKMAVRLTGETPVPRQNERRFMAANANEPPLAGGAPPKASAPYSQEAASLLLVGIALALAFCVLWVLCAVRIYCPF